MTLTRTDLEPKRLQEIIARSDLGLHVLSEEELQQSIGEMLQQHRALDDVWLFAYGSLIWNPIFRYGERRVCKIYGYHRRFCLWTPGGRGSLDNPGLTLGLDRGGSCRGVAYRIEVGDVPSELPLLWRREMVTGAYIPRWVKVFEGNIVLDAITFTVNPNHSMYAGNLSFEVMVEHIATARGRLGSCADYLMQTVNELLTHGIKDRQLLLLRDQVVARQQLLTST